MNRFITAQDFSYESALNEIKNGKKLTHWMWYIFPQIIGLGESSTSEYYAIKSLEEANEYLNHEVLGSRLRYLCSILLSLDNLSSTDIFGPIDSMKLKSSMTLFDYVSDDPIFSEVLDKYYNGEKCLQTIEICNTFNIKKLNKCNG